MTDHIYNGERGDKVRAKLNDLMDRTTDLEDAVSELDLDGNVISVNGKTGVVKLDYIDVGAEPTIGPKKTAFNKNFGEKAGEVAEGDHRHDLGDIDGLEDGVVTSIQGSETLTPETGDVTLDYIDVGAAPKTHDHDSLYAEWDHGHEMSDIDDLPEAVDELKDLIGSIATNLAFAGSYEPSTGKVKRAAYSITPDGESPVFEDNTILPDAGSVEPGKFLICVDSGSFPYGSSSGDADYQAMLSKQDWIVSDGESWVAIPYAETNDLLWDNIIDKPDFDELYAPISDSPTGYLNDAQGSIDNDGRTYARQNEEWVSIASVWDSNSNGDIYYNDGKVGIGTDDPKDKLHVDGGKLSVRNVGSAEVKLVDNTDGFCESTISSISTGTNRSSLILSTREGNSGVLPRLTIDAAGNVGIGGAPSYSLTIDDSLGLYGATSPDTGYGTVSAMPGNDLYLYARANQEIAFFTNGNNRRMTIDADGKVGIGIDPTTGTFDLSAKDQLAEWKTKAKKASWPIVTDGAFEEEPTEDLVAQWVETRAAGDKLQVKGNISATGKVAGSSLEAQGQMVVSAGAVYRVRPDLTNGGGGLYFNGAGVLPANPTGISDTEGLYTLGSGSREWKHVYGKAATFSGQVGIAKSPTEALSLEVLAPTGFSVGSGFYSSAGQSSITFSDAGTTASYKVRIGSEGDDLLMFAGGSERMRIGDDGNAAFLKSLSVGGGDLTGTFAGAAPSVTVGATYGAKISGSGSGIGLFGSNLVVNLADGLPVVQNSHSNYGAMGLSFGWGAMKMWRKSGAVTSGDAVDEIGRWDHDGLKVFGNIKADKKIYAINNGVYCELDASIANPRIATYGGTGLTSTIDAKTGNAVFSGTVTANEFVGDGSKLTGIETGLPDGDYEHSWNIKAKDFISTSDERLKTRIAPMPVGLIDDIKPVSWDWIDGGGKSAGVVAQQLQDIGLGDYVHENEEGQLGVNYQALTAILLAEVINLKAEVGALKS